MQVLEIAELAEGAQHVERDRLRLQRAVLVDTRVDPGGPPLADGGARDRVLRLAVPVERVLADVRERDRGHDAITVRRRSDEAEVDLAHHERRPVVLDHLLDRIAEGPEQLVLGVVEPRDDAWIVDESERVGLSPVDGDLLPVHGHGDAPSTISERSTAKTTPEPPG